MHLITMAHLGEAQGVIDLFRLKRLSPSVYSGETITCLITGEGPFEAATVTASELGKHAYQKVINLGIAGSLEDLEIGTIHPVRSVYLVIDGKPQFKSFKSFDQGLDCITSFERILSPEKALPLSGVASLVDREAWGVAMAAKTAGVPFASYKLISDRAGTLGACEIVKEQSQVWSETLAQHLKSILQETTRQGGEVTLPGFYFTFSTQNQFQQMLKKLSLREELNESEILSLLPIDELREEKLLPKERTRRLLSFMEGKLDPLKEKLDRGLTAWKLPFERQNITLQTDPTWETPEVKIQFSVTSQDALNEKLRALSDLNLEPFFKLRNGHVE